MEKKVPIYFDTIILNSPAQEVAINGVPNSDRGSRLKVAVFTKYKNRNGSYITDEYAELLIKSATRGNTPVVGFFDPETQDWASHTGPTLANGYGYVESFLGWEPITDTDGVTRDYAIFSVVLFSEYWEEANKIAGQNQSMELNPKTIQGSWVEFDGEEYFVYTQGDMLGLCVIGSHEPCFSVSHFFSKNDDAYKSQYEKFSSLLFNLRARVEEAKNIIKGGEQPMNEFENQEQLTPENNENIASTEVQEPDAFQAEANELENQDEKSDMLSEELADSTTSEFTAEPTEYEVLQQQYNELQSVNEQLQNNYTAAQARITELEEAQTSFSTQLDVLRTENAELKTSLSSYEEQIKVMENDRKNKLMQKYEKNISDAEKFSAIKESINDFSYDELESKLAIMYANQQIAGNMHEEKVPLPEPAESQFALLMKNYRKN